LFKPFVEDELPALCAGSACLVAHPAANAAPPRDPAGPITLAIGPEGGFIPYEIDKLRELGFSPFALGERILRVETAVTAILAKLF
jgi:RsmE family RNA methyltransferase